MNTVAIFATTLLFLASESAAERSILNVSALAGECDDVVKTDMESEEAEVLLKNDLESQVCTSMKTYSTYTWIHRLALMRMVGSFTEEVDTTHLQQIFESYEEPTDVCVMHSIEEENKIFLAMDMNGSDDISWTEFMAATMEAMGRISQEDFSSAFELLDFDENGYISTSDLIEIIGAWPSSVMNQIIDEGDKNGDHKICKDEFAALAKESTDCAGTCSGPVSNSSFKNNTFHPANTVLTKIEKTPTSHTKVDPLPIGACGLYLAPSTLPHAGLGIFTGSSIPSDSSINKYIGGTFPSNNDENDVTLWSDLYVPIADSFKALPYRGQQRFPSWLAYIWPETKRKFMDGSDNAEPFPTIPNELKGYDDGLNNADGLEFFIDDLDGEKANPDHEPSQRISAFVPGLASLANHGAGDTFANIDKRYKSSRVDYDGQEAPWDAGAGAFTPHHGVEFVATEDIVEGSELLIDYGIEWHVRNEIKLDHIKTTKKKGEDVLSGKNMRQQEGFINGIDKKWDMLDKREKNRIPNEIPTEKAKRDGLEEGVARDNSQFKNGEQPYSEYRKNDCRPQVDKDDGGKNDQSKEDGENVKGMEAIKPLSYLQENGVCLSSGILQVKSSPIEYAGRGVMATTHISEGEALLTSPLIAMRREDFVIYETDGSKKFVRDQIDKSSIVGTELLFNYAFSHPDSPLYLVPSAPMANFINHGGPFNLANQSKKDARNNQGANVKVRWPNAESNSAKLFEWAYNQEAGNHFSNDFDTYHFDEPNPWLKDHPIDVMERSGKLALEYVALRDIHQGEEILLDYGDLWDTAWVKFRDTQPYARSGYFRHAIGVPEGFFPDNWMNVGDRYEIAEIQDLENNPLVPGVAVPLTWAHNGKPVGSKYAYAVGLEKGFSEKFLEYSREKGIVELYNRLLTEQEGYHLRSDAFDVYQPATFMNSTEMPEEMDNKTIMEFFAHRYKSDSWNFNMHFVAAWSESARKEVLKDLSKAGFDMALNGIGERFGYDNMTCFHASYMGMSHCDKSRMHSDIYATEDKSWNIVFPLITVEGTEPELDILSEDMNTQIGVHYLKDVAYAMGDFGYHQTRPSMYYNPNDDGRAHDNTSVNGVDIRVVFGAYCAQVDETNVAMIRHIYDGDDPAPFADQFVDLPMREIHWDKATGVSTLANPGGKGFKEVE